MFDAYGISDWKKTTICIKWQATNIECLWYHKAAGQKQYSTMDTSETGLEKIIVERLGGQNGYEQHLTVSGETLKWYFLPHFHVKIYFVNIGVR